MLYPPGSRGFIWFIREVEGLSTAGERTPFLPPHLRKKRLAWGVKQVSLILLDAFFHCLSLLEKSF